MIESAVGKAFKKNDFNASTAETVEKHAAEITKTLGKKIETGHLALEMLGNRLEKVNDKVDEIHEIVDVESNAAPMRRDSEELAASIDLNPNEVTIL